MEKLFKLKRGVWIPAYAGMTEQSEGDCIVARSTTEGETNETN
jgi:hypothetical protein